MHIEKSFCRVSELPAFNRVYAKKEWNGGKVFLPVEDLPILTRVNVSEIEHLRFELVIAARPDTCSTHDEQTRRRVIPVELQLRIRDNGSIE